MKPEMILGGYNGSDYTSAKAFIVTFVLKNSIEANDIVKAEDWERTLLSDILETLNGREEWKGVRISYSTEVSSVQKRDIQ